MTEASPPVDPHGAAPERDGPDPGERSLSLAEALALAQRLQRSDRLDEAERLYLQVLGQWPGEPNTLHFLGLLRHQQGRQQEALALLSLAIERLPEAAGPWLNLANVLIECGLFDDAVKALDNASVLDPSNTLALNNLGILHLRRAAWSLAEAAFLRALALTPQAAYVHYNLAALYFQTGRLADCARHSLQSHGLDRNHLQNRMLITRVLLRQGQREQALENLREWVAEVPESAEAAHYLAALSGQAPPRAPDAYVAQLFDRTADAFDLHLDKLGYDGPQQVAQALAACLASAALPPRPRVLDAGCGTGLCLPVLRPVAGELEGVDLSAGMLRHAMARGGYDALHRAELTAFVLERPARYDLIVCTDVLIYFGDLGPVLTALRAALREGGVLLAGVEALDDGAPEPWELALSGRYRHAQACLTRQLSQAGFHLLDIHAHVVRQEMGEPVAGCFFTAVAQQPPGSH